MLWHSVCFLRSRPNFVLGSTEQISQKLVDGSECNQYICKWFRRVSVCITLLMGFQGCSSWVRLMTLWYCQGNTFLSLHRLCTSICKQMQLSNLAENYLTSPFFCCIFCWASELKLLTEDILTPDQRKVSGRKKLKGKRKEKSKPHFGAIYPHLMEITACTVGQKLSFYIGAQCSQEHSQLTVSHPTQAPAYRLCWPGAVQCFASCPFDFMVQGTRYQETR